MKNPKAVFEKIYSGSEAVWTRDEAHKPVVEILEKLKPCKTIEFGCGEATDAVFLAKHGFTMTAVDYSAKAIASAKQKAARAGVPIKFLVMNIEYIEGLGKFDFVLDHGLIHNITVEQRAQYVAKVAELLKLGGKYLSVCFNEASPEFGGPGVGYRKSNRDTILYYSSMEELKELFGQHFRILESKIFQSKGDGKEMLPHVLNYVFMEKPT